MKLLIVSACIVALLSFPATVSSEPLIGAQSLRDLPLGQTTEILARRAATAYGINADRFVATLDCESDHWQDGQSQIPNKHGPNGYEDSWGVAQIHLPAHPGISILEALDVRWSINWAASEFAAGRAREWSCYNLLYPHP